MAAAVLTRMPEIAKVDADLAHELERQPPDVWQQVLDVAARNNPAVAAVLGAAGGRIATPPVACVGQDLTGRVPLVLPSGAVPEGFHQPIRACAEQCFRELAEHRELFNRGGSLAELRVEHGQAEKQFMTLHPVTPDGFRSRVERHFLPMAYRADGTGRYALKCVTVTKDLAQALLASREMQVLLPAIVGLSGCPVLLADNRLIGQGYDADSGWLITNGEVSMDITVPKAVALINSLVGGFDFTTVGDHARAMAAFFAPAFRFGRFFARVPIDVAEADLSQSGKTYRQQVVAAVYGAEPAIITQRDGGVGSLDETFASRLHQGRPFILFDNVRGKLDSQYLEAYMTAQGRTFPVRVPHAGTVDIDPSGHCIFLSSNGVETTRDLANRSSIVRIRKRPSTYVYPTYDGLPLLAFVQQKQGVVLGAIYAILQDWIAAGRPHTNEERHDFREWAQAADWIVQNYFKVAPLMDGHEEAKVRVSDPGLSFIRRVALALEQSGRLGQELTATDVFQVCEDHGIGVPGLREQTEDAGRKRIGCIMRHAGLKDTSETTVDGYTVVRGERGVKRTDGTGYFSQPVYSFTRSARAPQ